MLENESDPWEGDDNSADKTEAPEVVQPHPILQEGAASVVKSIKSIDNPDLLTQLNESEKANKNRKTVLSAITDQIGKLTELAAIKPTVDPGPAPAHPGAKPQNQLVFVTKQGSRFTVSYPNKEKMLGAALHASNRKGSRLPIVPTDDGHAVLFDLDYILIVGATDRKMKSTQDLMD